MYSFYFMMYTLKVLTLSNKHDDHILQKVKSINIKFINMLMILKRFCILSNTIDIIQVALGSL